MPVPGGLPQAEARPDGLALAAQALRVPPLAPDVDRSVALDAGTRAGQPAAAALPGAEPRHRLDLPENRRVVLFCASDVNAPRKGLELLARALRSLDEAPLLLLAGNGDPPAGVESRSLGAVSDDAVLAQVYAAADVLAVPAVADALTQTAIESIACGTPCVSFDRGGVTDVVRHLETGYQARFGDVGDLARGLLALLDDADGFGPRCRRAAEDEFSVDLQVRRYVELYEQVLAEA
ncbi:MAG: glycosyltransferase [Actinobacteria bacterium]|nr:MAG: glycosyltransferase [Actinomycetota bacterium]